MRFARQTMFLALGVLLAGATVAGAQSTLYGVAFNGPDGLSTLYTIDPANGAATMVGGVGFQRCSGIDFDAAGTLFGTCERNDGSDTPVLVTIDTASGAGTEVGPTGITGAVSDVSFRNSDGVLFAYDGTNDPVHTLFTLSTATGAATLVGDTGLSMAPGNAMSFDLSDTLFHSQLTGGPNPDLNTLNQTNGLPTFVGQVAVSPAPINFPRLNAMDADPVSGVLYGIYNDSFGGGSIGPNYLVIVDPVALTANSVGQTQDGMDALAFAPAGVGGPSAAEIPTLSVAGLALLVLLLAGIAVLALRRRGSHAA
jgi:IPTL-CTERM motif